MVPPRPITTDDLDRDRVLAQRIALFGWVEPKHLDVPVSQDSNGFLMFAQQGTFSFFVLVAFGIYLGFRACQGQSLQSPA